jgi:amino acid adenylation domain-containing protein
MTTQTQALAPEMKPPAKDAWDSAHVTGLPVYHTRLSMRAEETPSLTVEIPGDLAERLHAITKGELLLQYAAVAAAVKVCLYRYTGVSRNVIGCPAMLTGNGASDGVVSIDVAVDGQLSFRQLLLDVRQAILDAYAEAAPNRRSQFAVTLEVPGLHQSMPDVSHDLALRLDTQFGPPALHAAYSPGLYDEVTVRRFCQHVLCILSSGLQNTDTPLFKLEILTDEERNQLREWNDTAAQYPKDKCVHELFEEHAANSPDRIALVFGKQRLTYRELNERANQVAHHLRRLHLTPNTPVGIFQNRSVEQVISVLGILKAGGAYVPYDPTYPKERLSAMFKDLKVKAVLTSERLVDRLPQLRARVICLDRDAEMIDVESCTNPVRVAEPSHLCYVIFTSGSTGRPKPTAVYHRGWTNLLHWFVTEFGITSTDKTLVISSISFDITQRAMAMPLISGGELHLVASDYYEPELILKTIDGERITVLNCAPSTFYPLVETTPTTSYQSLRSLRRLFLGGEAISASRVKPWATSAECKAQIANVYGAAECSDVSSFYRLHDYDRYVETSVPIGKPISNSQLYLVDQNLKQVPIGVTGEICLAGDGVGKGYLTDSFLTAQKFLKNPFAKSPDEYFYRTGDLGRYLPDGNLEFNGRIDHQVKVRGQRIELGDIETALRQHAEVKEAVVVDALYAPGDQRLIAYVVPNVYQTSANGLIDSLRTTLATKLPQYMIPNEFVLLEEMPLSPNGKIDRSLLPVPVHVSSGNGSNSELTTTEQAVAELYAKLLGKTNVSATSNFFDLGGHSLLVTQILAQISQTFQIQLEPPDFFKDPTVAGIARHIDAAAAKEQLQGDYDRDYQSASGA